MIISIKVDVFFFICYFLFNNWFIILKVNFLQNKIFICFFLLLFFQLMFRIQFKNFFLRYLFHLKVNLNFENYFPPSLSIQNSFNIMINSSIIHLIFFLHSKNHLKFLRQFINHLFKKFTPQNINLFLQFIFLILKFIFLVNFISHG